MVKRKKGNKDVKQNMMERWFDQKSVRTRESERERETERGEV